MRRFRFFLPMLVLLAGAAFFATGPAARADFTLEVTIFDDGTQVFQNSSTVSSGFNTLNYASSAGNTYGHFTLKNGAATSNAPGDAVLNAFVQQGQTSLAIQNNDTAAHTITIEVTANNFTLNDGFSTTVQNSGSGTILAGTATNGTVTGYLDTSNALATAFAGPSGGTTTPVITFSLPDSGGNKSFSGTTSIDTSLAGVTGYSLTDIESFRLSGGGIMSVTGSEALSVVPGPNTLALAAAALLGLGGFAIWRRRQVLPVA